MCVECVYLFCARFFFNAFVIVRAFVCAVCVACMCVVCLCVSAGVGVCVDVLVFARVFACAV